MRLKEIERTYVCQFAKYGARRKLWGFARRGDRNPAELVRYYEFVTSTLMGTPAWGVSGVNKMVNALTESLKAVRDHAKSGKTSAPAHAKKLLWLIYAFGDKETSARYRGRHKLKPILTADELAEIAAS